MGLAKNRKTKQKKWVYFSELEARWLLRKWASCRSPCTSRFPRSMQHRFDRCSGAAFGRSASCALVPGAVSRRSWKCRSLVSEYRINLDREIAWDWFVFQTELQNQTFLERFEDCADISRGRWRKTCWSCAVQKAIQTRRCWWATLSSLLCRWRARRYAYGIKSRPESERML